MGDYGDYLRGPLRKADGIANKIILTRNYLGKDALSFVLVEGSTDKNVYQRYIDAASCQIIVADGRENAIQALTILDTTNVRGVLAIVDADFDRLAEKGCASQNLLFTDTHDLETMILQSPAFEKLLIEFGSEDKIARLLEKHSKDVRSLLLDCAMPIGYLRWVSLRENIALKFEELSFEKFVDKEKLTIDVLKLIRHVQGRTSSSTQGQKQTPDSVLHNKMKLLSSTSYDPWHICCGHDIVCVLSLGLRKVIGSTKVIEPDMLEACLRLAYEHSHFCKTQLYISIQRWEATNAPFIVLKEEALDKDPIDRNTPT